VTRSLKSLKKWTNGNARRYTIRTGQFPLFFINTIHYLRLHAKEKAQILAKEKGLRLAEKEVKQIVKECADKSLEKKIEKILGKYNIVLTNYHSGSFIGKGYYRLLADNGAILSDLHDLLSNSEYRRNDVPENINAG
jgi:hypothetical protein